MANNTTRMKQLEALKAMVAGASLGEAKAIATRKVAEHEATQTVAARVNHRLQRPDESFRAFVVRTHRDGFVNRKARQEQTLRKLLDKGHELYMERLAEWEKTQRPIIHPESGIKKLAPWMPKPEFLPCVSAVLADSAELQKEVFTVYDADGVVSTHPLYFAATSHTRMIEEIALRANSGNLPEKYQRILSPIEVEHGLNSKGDTLSVLGNIEKHFVKPNKPLYFKSKFETRHASAMHARDMEFASLTLAQRSKAHPIVKEQAAQLSEALVSWNGGADYHTDSGRMLKVLGRTQRVRTIKGEVYGYIHTYCMEYSVCSLKALVFVRSTKVDVNLNVLREKTSRKSEMMLTVEQNGHCVIDRYNVLRPKSNHDESFPRASAIVPDRKNSKATSADYPKVPSGSPFGQGYVQPAMHDRTICTVVPAQSSYPKSVSPKGSIKVSSIAPTARKHTVLPVMVNRRYQHGDGTNSQEWLMQSGECIRYEKVPVIPNWTTDPIQTKLNPYIPR